MKSNFTFIKDVLPEAYNIAYGLEQDIIRDIPSSGEDFGQFLELLVNDMLEKKVRKITDRYVLFSERVSKLFNNKIIKESFKDKLKNAYYKRSRCVHVDPETNVTFKPPTSFYVNFVKEMFNIAILYYKIVEDEYFETPKYVAPYNLDRLKFENLDEEGQHKLDAVYKAIQEGTLPSNFIEDYFSDDSDDSENVISEESKIIETTGLKDKIEVSDVECGIIVEGSENETKTEAPISLDDFSKFLNPIKISNKEKILTKCLVCGNDTEDSNICTECLKKIDFSGTLKKIKRSLNENAFINNDLINLGYTQKDVKELISILKDFSLIKEADEKFIFNKNVVKNFLYLENVVDIEDLFVSFYNEEISSKNISESEFYNLGKEGNAVFNRFYLISSNIKFNRYIKDLTEDIPYEEAEEKNSISNDEIVDWYSGRINRFIQSKDDSSEENNSFIQKFILITEVLMNKWLLFRGKNLTKKEISNQLGLSNEITNFWFKKAEQYKFNEEYDIFDSFYRKRELVDMDLILKSISDDKSREEIANDANVKLSELNHFYELGMRKIEPYVSFYNEFKNNYVYKRIGIYIDNLKNNFKSSESQLNTNITSEELQDWYNQGKIDFITDDPKTERFINFFFVRTILLSNRWLSLRKESYSFEDASKEIEVSAAEVKEWLEFGNNNQYENLDGYQLFKNFYDSEQEIVIDSIINSLNEGKTLEEAALKENLTVQDLDGYYELGFEPTDEEFDALDNTFYEQEEDIYSLKSSESDRYPYNKYYDYIEYVFYPKMRTQYLRLLSEGKSIENAAKLCELDMEDITDWYAKGWLGITEYVDFYNDYLNIKIEDYKDNIIKGKTKEEALKSAYLDESEISNNEDEINKDIIRKRMDSVLKEVKSGKNSEKIAKKFKINQSDIFEWFEKGLNGETDYIDFYKEYFENYVSIGCEAVSSYFAKGLNKKQALKRIKREGHDFDIGDLNHWQSIGLLMDEKDYKNNQDVIENIEDGVIVDDVGDIKELDQNALNLSITNLCLFKDDLGLVINEKNLSEFKVRLNYANLYDTSKISYTNKTIEENYKEMEYSKRLQSAYLDILSYKDFNDYENIWYWVLKKTNEPDFDISHISKEEIKQDTNLVIEEEVIFTPENILLEEEISLIDYTDDSSYVSDSIGLLDDYVFEEDDWEDDEERKKDYALVSQFINELGKEDDIFSGSIDENYKEDLEIEPSENIGASFYVEEPITEVAGSSSSVKDLFSKFDSIDQESFNQKIQSLFGNKTINKELTESIKEEYNIPNYVIEFLIDKFSENGVDYESIIKVLKYSLKPTIPKPNVFEVVDKVSVSLFYKANKYFAKFNNLNYSLEIDPSYPFQYEKLLSDNVWAYVKLNNEENMCIDDLELIECPYFRIGEITDFRKEFTKEEWIDLLLSSCGINPNAITYETKLLLILRLVPFVQKNFYLCEISDKGSLKDIFYKNISFNNAQINETLYGLFYNQQKHKNGLISYFDSINIKQFVNIEDINKKDIILNYIARKDTLNKDSINGTSLIFSDNSKDYILDFVKNSNISNIILNSILCDSEFLENIHCIIPSFDNEEFNNLDKKHDVYAKCYGFNLIVLSEYFKKLRELDYSELYLKHFKFGEGIKLNDYNAIMMMYSALIKLLYPDDVYVKDDIREIIEICLKSRKVIKRIFYPDIELSYIDVETGEEIFV